MAAAVLVLVTSGAWAARERCRREAITLNAGLIEAARAKVRVAVVVVVRRADMVLVMVWIEC